MKNIINFFKNTLLNNKGKMSANVMAGVGVGVFAAVIGYNTYTAYNNSPAYNPANRAIYTGEGLNLSLNSFDGNRVDLQTSGALPGEGYGGSGIFHSKDGFTDSNTIRNQANKEQADFDAARAYIDAQRSGGNQTQGAYSNGNVYDPFGSTYEQGVGGIEEGSSVGSRNSEAQFQALQQAAAGGVKGKGGKGSSKNGAQTVRQATQKGKLTSSKSAGSSFSANTGAGSGSASVGGGNASFGGGNTIGGKDNNTRALPQASTGQTADGQAFKFGRAGSIGGFNVANGGKEGNAKGGKGGNAKSELNAAYSLSKKAVATLQEGGDKALATGAQEAANAFDGGAQVEGGTNISGDVPIDISGNKLGLKLKKKDLGLDKIETDFETRAQKKGRLQRNVWNHMINAGIITVCACFLIAAVMKMKHWVKYIIAGVITLAALYAIWGADYDGDGMNIYKTISELTKMRQEDGQSNQNWIYYGLMSLYTGSLGLAWWLGVKSAKKAASGFMKMINDTAKGEFINRSRNMFNSAINNNSTKEE